MIKLFYKKNGSAQKLLVISRNRYEISQVPKIANKFFYCDKNKVKWLKNNYFHLLTNDWIVLFKTEVSKND